MAERDKITELVEELEEEGYLHAERKIRAKLKPLLATVAKAQSCIRIHAEENKCLCREMLPELAAELQGWRKD